MQNDSYSLVSIFKAKSCYWTGVNFDNHQYLYFFTKDSFIKFFKKFTAFWINDSDKYELRLEQVILCKRCLRIRFCLAFQEFARHFRA